MNRGETIRFKVKKNTNLEYVVKNAFFARDLLLEKIGYIIEDILPNGDFLYMHAGENILEYIDYKPFFLDSFGSKYKKDVPKGVECHYSAGMYWWSIYEGKKSSEILNKIGDYTQKKEMFEILKAMGMPNNMESWKSGCFKVLREKEGYILEIYSGAEYIPEEIITNSMEKIS